MTIIEIAQNDNGSHNNQTIYGVTPESFPVPDGWALVPDEIQPLSNYPFGDVTIEEIDGIQTVTGWSPLPIPAPEPDQEPQPSQLDRVEAQVAYTAMMTDTLLEV